MSDYFSVEAVKYNITTQLRFIGDVCEHPDGISAYWNGKDNRRMLKETSLSIQLLLIGCAYNLYHYENEIFNRVTQLQFRERFKKILNVLKISTTIGLNPNAYSKMRSFLFLTIILIIIGRI